MIASSAGAASLHQIQGNTLMNVASHNDGEENRVQSPSDGLASMTARKRIVSMLAATGGSLIEWFDFYIYTFMAIYFSPAFFPSGDPTTQLLAAAGIFAAGFLARPVGGWFFGWMADTIGRKRSMIISVNFMCIGAFMCAFVPTYETIGVAAPLLLLFARLLQGFSVGGGYGSVATYITEAAAPGRRGFYASWQYVTILGAQLMSILLLYILQSTMEVADLKAWGWRIPFVIGAVLAVIVAYLRRKVTETASTGALKSKGAGTIGVLAKHRKAVILVLMFTSGGSLYFYTFTTYLQKLFVNSAGMDPKKVSVLMAFILTVMMVLQPVFGAMSDRFGRKKFMIAFGFLAMVATVPLLSAMSKASSVTEAIVLGLTAVLIACFYTSISGVLKAELFPTEVRTLGVSLPYAVANALFGGSAEYVALQLKSWGVESTFFWYVAGMAALTFIGGLWMPDMRKASHLDGSSKV
jgi:MFS family permease